MVQLSSMIQEMTLHIELITLTNQTIPARTEIEMPVGKCYDCRRLLDQTLVLRWPYTLDRSWLLVEQKLNKHLVNIWFSDTAS